MSALFRAWEVVQDCLDDRNLPPDLVRPLSDQSLQMVAAMTQIRADTMAEVRLKFEMRERARTRAPCGQRDQLLASALHDQRILRRRAGTRRAG